MGNGDRFCCLGLSDHGSGVPLDYDTLQQERSRFPTALELMTGRFPRHSPEFYHWRLEDRKRKLAASAATPELLDDLAVSYDKLGDHAQAIATMQDCERQFPGRYETAANLGTFYFHAGQFQGGFRISSGRSRSTRMPTLAARFISSSS